MSSFQGCSFHLPTRNPVYFHCQWVSGWEFSLNLRRQELILMMKVFEEKWRLTTSMVWLYSFQKTEEWWGKWISSVYKAWKTQKCKQSAWSWLLLSLLHLTWKITGKKAGFSFPTQIYSHKIILLIQILLSHKGRLLTQAAIIVDIYRLWNLSCGNRVWMSLKRKSACNVDKSFIWRV